MEKNKKKEIKKKGRKRKRKKGFPCPLHRTLKRRGSCRGALRPLGRAMLSGCQRRTVSPTPRWTPEIRGRDLTFRQAAGGSIIDLTFAAPRLASRIVDWCVLQVINLSGNQCIEFNIQERSHPVNTGRGGKGRSPSWNTRRLSKDKLPKHLEGTRHIDELGWAKSAGSLEDTVRVARRKVVAACDHSMPRRGHGRTGESMY